jgi:hypothetical protein
LVSRVADKAFQVFLGYLLVYTMISRYVYSGSEQASQKGNELLIKMAPLQGKVGVAGFVAGMAYLLLISLD